MLRSKNALLIEGAESVVTSCPGCTIGLRKINGIEPLHIIEHLYESKGISHLRFRPSSHEIRIALHEPCHLKRVVGPHVIDYAHQILSAIPGVKVVDMEGSSECCGGGGGVASGYPALAAKQAASKVQNARYARADILIAPCPFCVLNLSHVGGIEVKEFTDFVASYL